MRGKCGLALPPAEHRQGTLPSANAAQKRGAQHPAPVPPGDLLDLGDGEPGRAQRRQDRRQAAHVAELARHHRAVEVRAERDRADARHGGHVRGVLGDRRERRVVVVGAVGAQEADVEVDPDQAAARADRAQLIVGQVARGGAECVRAGVRGDERRAAQLGDLPEPARVEMREVDEDPQLGAGADQRPPGVREPRPLIGRSRERERHAGGERVRPAPDQPERAHARGVQDLELVEPGAIGSAPSRCRTAASPSASSAAASRAMRSRPPESRSSRSSSATCASASASAAAARPARSTRPSRSPRRPGSR